MLSQVTSLGHREPRKASEESKNSRIPAVGGQLRQLCAEEREHRDGRDRAAVPGPRVVQLRDGGGPSQTAGTGGMNRHRDTTLGGHCFTTVSPASSCQSSSIFFRVAMSLASR